MSSRGLPDLIYVLSDQVDIAGGAAKATLLLCETLADAGSEVILFVTLRPDEQTLARLEAKGVRIKSALLARGSRVRLPARSISWQLWLACRRRPPALVHAMGLVREVRQFLALPGPPPPTFLWETTEALPGNKFIDRKIRGYLHRAAALLVPSRAVERNARTTYRYLGRIEILPFWTEHRAVGTVSAPDTVPRKLLFIGRMDEDKGFRYLIPAFEKARRRLPRLEIAICGSGTPSRIPELVNPPDGVRVLGRVKQEVLEGLLAGCAAMVLPSLHEGYPLTLLEACSFGKPVIASAVGSIPEVFAGRDCALLVPPADTGAIEQAMVALLSETPAQYAVRCADARALYEIVNSPATIMDALRRAYAFPSA